MSKSSLPVLMGQMTYLLRVFTKEEDYAFPMGLRVQDPTWWKGPRPAPAGAMALPNSRSSQCLKSHLGSSHFPVCQVSKPSSDTFYGTQAFLWLLGMKLPPRFPSLGSETLLLPCGTCSEVARSLLCCSASSLSGWSFPPGACRAGWKPSSLRHLGWAVSLLFLIDPSLTSWEATHHNSSHRLTGNTRCPSRGLCPSWLCTGKGHQHPVTCGYR